MKFKISFLLSLVAAFVSILPAKANETAPMCSPQDSYSHISTEDLSCDPEDYGFTYNSDGNLTPLEFDYHDGPTISNAPPQDRVSHRRPRTIQEEGEIVTGSVLGSALYWTSKAGGRSHEEAMDMAEFGYHAGSVIEGVAGSAPIRPNNHQPRRNTGSEYYP
ncbi:hypothetical protein [Adonisia turfae]|uniref:Uncharacterized protein n=1 Tax=Adonisia turfae CCMR0081 TaxID=2292702 RepID=A0A6M0RRH2_9CYAN|nr:hypothetical protein [Adonisia turfae]NEZ58709.1 hypothetical protein [Adonisia turfae CCMR0081]